MHEMTLQEYNVIPAAWRKRDHGRYYIKIKGQGLHLVNGKWENADKWVEVRFIKRQVLAA